MAMEMAALRDAGADGFVIGCLTADGDLDGKAMELLLKEAAGLGLTLHRCIDVSRNLESNQSIHVKPRRSTIKLFRVILVFLVIYVMFKRHNLLNKFGLIRIFVAFELLIFVKLLRKIISLSLFCQVNVIHFKQFTQKFIIVTTNITMQLFILMNSVV